jgi:putative tricarboxylic transport membrane protein
VFKIDTIDFLGWAISGEILFAGCALALGRRSLLRDVLFGVVISVASWYFFYSGLDIPLSPGILDGIL